MAIPNRYHTVAALERDGWFEVARRGDRRACGLFARLCAYEMNPAGDPAGFGFLSKIPGQTQVDGYAEDAICFGADPYDLRNVVDLIVGAGAAGASTGWQEKPRLAQNLWVRPYPLTTSELEYLKPGSTGSGGGGGGTQPKPEPPKPALPPYPGDQPGFDLGAILFADYAEAGQDPNPGMGVWFNRTLYDYLAGMTFEASVAKHRKEWREALGLPPA